MACLSQVSFRPHASEAKYSRDCRQYAQPFGAAILPGRVGGGGPATNNEAERALRTAVQWRKISFGNRSRGGETATARLLTVAQTCKRQRRHVLGYLTEAVRCHRRQIAAPSLLPRRI